MRIVENSDNRIVTTGSNAVPSINEAVTVIPDVDNLPPGRVKGTIPEGPTGSVTVE